MTESPSSAAEQLFAALAELRQATVVISFATLVRQAAAQQPPLKISGKRSSDWFLGKAVPAILRSCVSWSNISSRASPGPAVTSSVRCRGG